MTHLQYVIQLTILIASLVTTSVCEDKYEICDHTKYTGPNALDFDIHEKYYQAFHDEFYIQVGFVDEVSANNKIKVAGKSLPIKTIWENLPGMPQVTSVFLNDMADGSMYFRENLLCTANIKGNGTPEECVDFNDRIKDNPSALGLKIISVDATGLTELNTLVMIGRGTQGCTETDTDCPEVGWHALYDMVSEQISGVMLYKDIDQRPKSISLLQDRTRVAFIVIYDGVWTTVSDDLTRPFQTPRDRPVYSSAIWLGCPMELCIESNFDAANRNDNGHILVYRHRYVWDLRFDPQVEPSTPVTFEFGEIQRNLDASATLDNNTRIIFRRSNYFLTSFDGKLVLYLITNVKVRFL